MQKGNMSARRTPLHRYALLSPEGAKKLGDERQKRRGRHCVGSFEFLGYPGEFTAAGNLVRLETIALAYLSYGAPSRIHCAGISAVRQQFCLQGSAVTSFGSQCQRVDPELPCLIPPDEEVVYDFDGNFSQIVLYIDAAALRGALSKIIGLPLGQGIVFSANDPQNAELRRLRRLIGFLVAELDREDAPLSIPAQRELEHAVLASFLHANRHNYSHLLERDLRRAAPWQVRRAEEYIEANWNRPLSIQKISAATGVNARSLFKTFRQARGYSPMAYLKQVRLAQARQMLSSSGERTSVTAVAFACGFDNPGHFAGTYRMAYGELPSQTLLKVRGPVSQGWSAAF